MFLKAYWMGHCTQEALSDLRWSATQTMRFDDQLANYYWQVHRATQLFVIDQDIKPFRLCRGLRSTWRAKQNFYSQVAAFCIEQSHDADTAEQRKLFKRAANHFLRSHDTATVALQRAAG